MKQPLYFLFRVRPASFKLALLMLLLPLLSQAATEPTTNPTVTVAPTRGLTAGTAALVLTLTGGNGSNNLVVIRPTANAAATPQDGTAYTGNLAYGNGTAIGTNNFVVSTAAATTTSLTVTGLAGGTSYTVSVYAFNQDAVAPTTNYRTATPGTAVITAPTTYFWRGATGAAWKQATSWTPNRNTPDATDIIVFDGTTFTSTEAVPMVVDYNPGNGSNHDETMAQLFVVNNAIVTMTAAGTGNQYSSIIIDGGYSGDDFVVASGSALTFSSTSATANRYMLANITSGEVAAIRGKMTMTSGNSGALPHRIQGADANSVRFIGTTATFTTTALISGNPFGELTSTTFVPGVGSVVFNSGATYLHQGGADPFGPGSPITQFLSGSFYIYSGGTFSPNGQRYGNLEFRAAATVAGTGNLVVQNNLTVTTGVVALNLNGTGVEPGVLVAGDLAVATGATLSRTPTATSYLLFNGSAAQAVSGAGTITLGSLVNLGIKNTSSAGVTLQRPLTTAGSLALLAGRLNTSATNILSMPATAQVTAPGGLTSVTANTSFVNGPMTRTLGTAGLTTANETTGTGLFFPIGLGTQYRPVALTLNQSAAVATAYTAQVVNGSPAPLTFTGSLQRVSRIRHYALSTNAATTFSAGQIKLFYGIDDQVDAPSKLRIARSNGTAWADLGSSAPAVADGTTFLVGNIASSNAFTGLGNFVLASTVAANAPGNNPLPVELTALSAEREGSGVQVRWATASEQNNDRFEVLRSADGKTFQLVGTVQGSGTSAQPRSYAFFDAAPLPGLSYYRLRQLDFDGTATLSPVVTVTTDSPAAAELQVYPNPAADHLTLRVATGEVVSYRVITLMGQPVLSGRYPAARLEVQALRPGTYLLELRTTGGRRLTTRFVKQ
ncbi:T9SS type A sorting domain-containing protein [Hymenobacter sp. B81]|uniref:T9SS type A sorting domain-containing protein n=1 Tax=Hymenobacter sp. B81 TaxID=3344878 RepID=UPI0037DD7257